MKNGKITPLVNIKQRADIQQLSHEATTAAPCEKAEIERQITALTKEALAERLRERVKEVDPSHPQSWRFLKSIGAPAKPTLSAVIGDAATPLAKARVLAKHYKGVVGAGRPHQTEYVLSKKTKKTRRRRRKRTSMLTIIIIITASLKLSIRHAVIVR